MEKVSFDLNTGSSDQWNQSVIVKLIPIYIILIIYLILGILGNSLVLFVYVRKFKTYSEGRYFVPVLAATDMLSCVVSSCGHASETLLPIIYKIDIACKIERYLRMVTTAFAMFTLVLIVIDRYLKVCRPYGRQMTKPWKKSINRSGGCLWISRLGAVFSLLRISAENIRRWIDNRSTVQQCQCWHARISSGF